MKVYICSDIEGTCGFSKTEEGNFGYTSYPYFASLMTSEVKHACLGALDAGATEILVHDAHGCARNINPSELPEKVEILRGSTGDPYAMMCKLDKSFDACFLTGFHSGVGSDGNTASHTFNRKTSAMFLNDMPLSEMLFDIYTATNIGVPTCLITGDQNICNQAKELIPNITTVTTLKGVAFGSISTSPKVAQELIKQGATKALSGDYKSCFAKLPSSYTMRIRFNNHFDAYFNSFYPNIKQLDSLTLEYTSKNWYDILTMVHFVLDK